MQIANRHRRARTAMAVAAVLAVSGILVVSPRASGAQIRTFQPIWKQVLPAAPVLESTPVAADLDGDGTLEMAFGTTDGWVFALHGPNGSALAGWPQKTSDPISSSPAIADTDGDGKRELFVGSGNHDSPGGALYSYRRDGGLRFRFQASDPHRSALPIHATPALGDVTGDGVADASFGALGLQAWSLAQSGSLNSGWPYYTDDTVFSSAALVDVDGDGRTDVVMGGDSTAGGPIDFSGGLVRAISGTGQLLWEFRINDIVRSSPSVGDVDGDGVPEIVFGAGNFYRASDSTKVFALDLSGHLKPGWPQNTDGWTVGSPALADVDGDGKLDVAMGTWRPTTGGSVYAWSGNGNVLQGFPQSVVGGAVIGSPTTADFNGDGAQDVLVTTGAGAFAYDGKTGATLFQLASDATFQNSAAIADVDGNGLVDVLLAGDDRAGHAVAYRFELPASDGATLGALGWPMFRKDAARTGSWAPAGVAKDLCADPKAGYWLTAADGGIFAFCAARFHGSTGNIRLAQPIVGMAPTPSGNGYWLTARDGGLFNFGDATFQGSTGNLKLARPIVGMAPTPGGTGYWMVASDGGIFAFGDAGFKGSTGNLKLAQPIVGMTPTPGGNGYWMVASDGGIFAFGDAGFKGSTGSIRLAKPIVGMTATPSGQGYWMVASDGGIFAFGDAGFHGSTGNIKLAKPSVGMTPTPSGRGYWMVASDGGIFAFGDAAFHGSTGGIKLAQPIVGMAVPKLP